MPGLVDIVLADGQHATVPQEDLSQAVSAGARVPTSAELEKQQIGGLLGQAETAVLGAGRTATFGLSDAIVAEGANVIGGEGLRKDTLKALSLAKEANPYSNMAGEFAGMLVGGPTDLGGFVEEGVASRLGEGLTGRVASMGARGAVEGGAIGAQSAFSEAQLGDHEVNGQKLAAHIGEGALLGGAMGAGLGFAAHGLTSAVENIRGPRGPMSNAVADEIAGVEGGGKLLREEAAQTQALIDDFAKAGATTDQAAKMADEALTLSRGRSNAGPMTGTYDEIVEQAILKRAGGNEEIADAYRRHYASRSKQLIDHDAALDGHALGMKEKLDRVFRMRETIDRLNFTERPDQFARLMGTEVNYSAARDMVARMGQEAEAMATLLDSTATKGGGDVALKKMGKQLADMRATIQRLPVEGGSAAEARDAYMAAYRMKQFIGKNSGFGTPEHLRTPAQNEFATLYKTFQTGLENTEAFGQAGSANAEWNRAFSDGFRRAQDFESRFAVRIDEANGVPVPEAGSEKLRDGLLKKVGNAVEREQPLKSTEAYVNWIKDRTNAIEKYAEILPSDAAKIAEGRAALKEFEGTLGSVTKDAEAIAKIKQLQLEEQGKGLGGLLGLGADVIQRPLTTIERLASVRNATKKVEQAIEGGLKRFFGGKSGSEVVAEFKPRTTEAIAKDIGEVRQLAANGPALDLRARQAVGDMTKIAPKTAEAAMATFKRAVYFLANEAPPPIVRLGVLGMSAPEPRYSAQQAHEWETKKRAAFDPKTVVFDMKSGRLNREAIRTIEFVSPKLYAEIQHSAQEWVLKKQSDGTIDKMPRAQQAALASLLKVPADGTWQPDFMLMMQAAKAMPAPTQSAPAAGPQTTTKRAIKVNSGAWETEAMQIERR